MFLIPVIKSGRLTNGFERGKGKVVHAAESEGFAKALCGTKPGKRSGSGFLSRPDLVVNCSKCVGRMLKD